MQLTVLVSESSVSSAQPEEHMLISDYGGGGPDSIFSLPFFFGEPFRHEDLLPPFFGS